MASPLSLILSFLQVLPQFRPEELARLMHSLSTLSFYSAPLFIRAEGTIMDSLDEYSAEDLALIATAFVNPPPLIASYCPSCMGSPRPQCPVPGRFLALGMRCCPPATHTGGVGTGLLLILVITGFGIGDASATKVDTKIGIKS